MSLDLLTYRFPGKEIERKVGRFTLLPADQIEHGFVFTNFQHQRCYLFEEETNASRNAIPFHFLDKKPIVISAREYYLQAHELLNGMNMMQMDKAVFSRIKKVSFDERKTEAFFEKLVEKYPNAMVYLVSSEAFGTWIGASPEILLEAHREHLFTISLAGTKRSDDTHFEWRDKEKIEQSLVTEFIENQLKKLHISEIELNGPYDYEAGPVCHLRTDFSAQLNGVDPWKIALQLHPTPAVSGLPRDEAISLIETVEPHHREIYTGMFGFVSPEKTQLYVNLRCAQIQEDSCYLYLGGGYTLQSVPEDEWIETENKSKTLLNVLAEL